LVWSRIQKCTLHAPGHIDAEALSCLGQLEQAGVLTADSVVRHLATIAAAPIERHAVAELLPGAFYRRNELPLSSALYVELAATLGTKVITTDTELARSTPVAELVQAAEAN
jgi:predicted nucleic acid-binding protein